MNKSNVLIEIHQIWFILVWVAISANFVSLARVDGMTWRLQEVNNLTRQYEWSVYHCEWAK